MTVTTASMALLEPGAPSAPGRVVGIDLEVVPTPWQPSLASLSQCLHHTAVRLVVPVATADSGPVGQLRLVCRDEEAHLTDAGIAEVLAALGEQVRWVRLAKLHAGEPGAAAVNGPDLEVQW